MLILLRIITALELLAGGFGLYLVVYLATYRMRTGDDAGIGWLYLPFAVAFICFGLLGTGLLFRKMWSRWLHLVLLPLAALVLILWWGFLDFDRAFTRDALGPSLAGAGVFIFLLLPKTRALFK